MQVGYDFQNWTVRSEFNIYFLDLDSEESEYDAYVFYQLLEEQTSPHHTLVEDIKITAELAKVTHPPNALTDLTSTTPPMYM